MTPDDTVNPIAASVLQPQTLAAPFVTTYAGHHYIGLMVNAGTGTTPVPVMPTAGARSGLSSVVGNVMVDGGKPNGNSSAGLTDPASLTSPAAAIATIGNLLWVGVG